jgi:hypothetical protein
VTRSAGQALWHAVECHATTLYRRAVSSGAVDRFDPAVDAARIVRVDVRRAACHGRGSVTEHGLPR